jgi:hypothetical protein
MNEGQPADRVFVHLAVHHPRPGRERSLAESMDRFGAPAHGRPGFRFHATLADADQHVLVGITIWDSIEAWAAVLPDQRAATARDDFDDLWERPPDVYRLTVLSPPAP